MNPKLLINIIANTQDLIANLNAGRGAIEAYGPSVAKMQTSWQTHGAKVVEQAALITAALKGVAVGTLTAADAAKNLKSLEAGMAQLAKEGKPIPPLMQQTADALRAVVVPAQSLSERLTSLGPTLQAVGSSMRTTGTVLSAAITAPLVGAAGASVVFAGTFEASMTRLVSIAGVSRGELEGVKQHILNLAPAVGIGPQALAEAMTKVSSTVSDTGTALAILDIAAQGSKAGFGEVIDVAGALTTVLNSYGTENLTAARAADILAMAVKEGGAEAKELAPVLANVVPFAAQLGVSFEEVAANIATMTKLGVPTAEAVTSLTSVFSALSKETAEGTKTLSAMGTSYDEIRQVIKEKGLAATLQDLTVKFGGNVTAMVDVFGRIEAVKNVMGTAGVQAQTYSTVLDRVKNSSQGADGAMTNMANAMSGTQVQSWKELTATLQVAAIKFGDALAPSMKKALDAAKPLLDKVVAMADWFAQLPGPVQTAVIAFGAVVAALGPVLFLLGGVMQGIAALLPLIALTSSAFGMASGAFTALAGGSGMLATGLGILKTSVIGLATSLGPLAIAIGSATAVIAAGYQAWKLYGESQERAKLDSANNAVVQRALADASRIAGRAITDSAEAHRILGEHAATLRAKIAAVASVQENTAVPVKKLTLLTDEQREAVKKQAKALQDLTEKFTGAGLLQQARDYEVVLQRMGGTTRLTTAEQKQFHDVFAAVVEKYKFMGPEGAKVVAHFEALAIATQPVLTSTSILARVTLPDVINRTRELQNVAKGLTEEGLVPAFLATEQVRREFEKSIPPVLSLEQAMGRLMTTRLPGVASGAATVRDAVKGAKEQSDAWKGKLDDLARSMAQLAQTTPGIAGTIAGAFGSITNAINVGVKSFDSMKQGFESFKSGDILGGITNLASGIGGLIQVASLAWQGLKKLFGFGASAEELAARKTVAEFEQQLATLLTAQQKIEAAGRPWAASVIAVRDAYVAVGLSERQAELDVKALWESSKLGAAATEAAIKKIQEAFDEQKRRVALTEEATNLLKAAADRYKFSIDELGPAFQRQRLSEMAEQLYSDFTILVGSGIDVGTVTSRMSEKINEYLGLALKTGQEVPIAMRPMIERMMEMGLLTDASGNQITDLESSGIQFSESMTQGFTRVVEKLDELVRALSGDFTRGMGAAKDAVDATGRAIDALPDSIRIPIEFDVPDLPEFSTDRGGEGGGAPGFAMGTGGRFIDFGRGTPVVLHGKERIVTERESRAEGTSTAALEAEVRGLRGDLARVLRDQPRAISVAVHDALVLGRAA